MTVDKRLKSKAKFKLQQNLKTKPVLNDSPEHINKTKEQTTLKSSAGETSWKNISIDWKVQSRERDKKSSHSLLCLAPPHLEQFRWKRFSSDLHLHCPCFFLQKLQRLIATESLTFYVLIVYNNCANRLADQYWFGKTHNATPSHSIIKQ